MPLITASVPWRQSPRQGNQRNSDIYIRTADEGSLSASRPHLHGKLLYALHRGAVAPIPALGDRSIRAGRRVQTASWKTKQRWRMKGAPPDRPPESLRRAQHLSIRSPHMRCPCTSSRAPLPGPPTAALPWGRPSPKGWGWPAWQWLQRLLHRPAAARVVRFLITWAGRLYDMPRTPSQGFCSSCKPQRGSPPPLLSPKTACPRSTVLGPEPLLDG